MASTVDVLSHGRFTLGIGAGWYEQEYRAYGYDYPPAPKRLRQLREAIQIILAMWTQEEATYAGNYYQVRGAINQPKGVQQPHIPLLIGGDGEQVTLKLVAQYADACNVRGDPATVARKFAVLKEHCEAVGRDYESIRRTVNCTFCVITETDEQARTLIPEGYPGAALIGTVETIRGRIAGYEALGAQELVVGFRNTSLDQVRRFAEAFINQ